MTSQKIPSIQSLKSLAKKIAAQESIALSKALDQIACRLGFSHWALLQKHFHKISLRNVDSIWQALVPGELLLLAAGENVGKSSMALNIAVMALRDNYAVSYCSLHMNRQAIVERLSSIANVNKSAHYVNSNNFMVDDAVEDSATVLAIVKKMPGDSLIIIDYLQALVTNDNYQQLLRQLRQCAQEKNIKIIVLSQMSHQPETIALDYLGGGASITRHFSHVLHLDTLSQQEAEGQRDMTLLKSTYYQKQTSLVEFDRSSFCFS